MAEQAPSLHPKPSALVSPALQRAEGADYCEWELQTPSSLPNKPVSLMAQNVLLPLCGRWEPDSDQGLVEKKRKRRADKGLSGSAKSPVPSPRAPAVLGPRKRKAASGSGITTERGSDGGRTELGGLERLKLLSTPSAKRRVGVQLSSGRSLPEKSGTGGVHLRSQEGVLPSKAFSLSRDGSLDVFIAQSALKKDTPRKRAFEAEPSVESTGDCPGQLGGLLESPLDTPETFPEGNWGMWGSTSGPREGSQERTGQTFDCATGFGTDSTGLRKGIETEATGLGKGVVSNWDGRFGSELSGRSRLSEVGNSGVSAVTVSLTTLLTDHMRSLLDAQEAQFGEPGFEGSVELSPGQIATILDKQGKMRAALEFFKTLTPLEPTGLGPLTGDSYSPGKPSFSGTHSYASETVCPGKSIPPGDSETGFEKQVTELETGLFSQLTADRVADCGFAPCPVGNGHAEDPLLSPFDVLAGPAADTWQHVADPQSKEWGEENDVEAYLLPAPVL